MYDEDFLDFEQPVIELKKKFDSFLNENPNQHEKNNDLKKKIDDILKKIYSNLTPWQKVQVARHPKRPHTIDYIENLITDFIPLSGDKKYAEDKSIISGIGTFEKRSIMVIGTEKGNSTETRIKHNFGMAKPEGYRKVQRLYRLADKFNLPILTFVDTAGAFPGKEAEERGQSEAIANSISVSLNIKTPIISTIIGEGGSGGAIALATADKVLMLENSVYSVISPEGCASILWRDPNMVKQAANALNLTASNCSRLGVIDEIIPELPGGAHRNYNQTFVDVKKSINNNLQELLKINEEDLVSLRNEKYLNITSNLNQLP
ncbi:MAG: Acetyl-coenzyme A carboxylase carboxyl transferase subunit alpha [Alphaproteobacteria bacterium MarineAlpha5_Bin12]|nr:acetyl-CoA carboxylase carboxyl transferase subunit alpha [Pelagibacteraceae bacterium]PPR41321.1 MAG: Acetyl-coenzyme A carboxylase carboxyl transferase subunit alpha [Alphaproteobacteria bacterium MarineAlpha5_Bin12]|tara:strand:+ start:14672 stop:15628 length:957 start_codon:yes stop_codon:yes gene_type:complete